jgi:hypothetical protein
MQFTLNTRKITMKISRRLKENVRVAAPLLLAILLTIALAGTALANPTGGALEPNDDPNIQQGNQQTGNQNSGIIDTGDPNINEGGNEQETAEEETAEEETAEEETVQEETGTTPTPHADAPFSPPADCIVAHAATPAQLCPVGGGLQYYFIGSGGSQTGPWIQSLSDLATLHAGVASIYTGTNPFTGKSVQIHYLPSEQKIRISTFYPDNQYDTNKPYNFTVDTGNTVNHEAW